MSPKMADIFSGIGLASAGFKRAGFEPVYAIDIDKDACAVYEKNLGLKPKAADIRSVTGQEILNEIGIKRGELDLIVGCPPCQGFSSLRRTRLRKRQRDSRRPLLGVFGDRISELLPSAVFLENVAGLTVGRNRSHFLKFVNCLKELGYNYAFGILDAADYGAPQHRRRLILFAIRGRLPALPCASHSSPERAEGEKKEPWRTVRSAIGALPEPAKAGKRDMLHVAANYPTSTMEIIKAVPKNGGSRTEIPKGLWLDCHKGLLGAASAYGRLSWDKPSGTITTRALTPSCGRFTHPSQDRGMTLREAARLQTIPDNYRIEGTKMQMATWIGNAVPMVMASRLGSFAMHYFEE